MVTCELALTRRDVAISVSVELGESSRKAQVTRRVPRSRSWQESRTRHSRAPEYNSGVPRVGRVIFFVRGGGAEYAW